MARGAYPNDRDSMGDLVLQDFRGDVDVHYSSVSTACRIVKRDSQGLVPQGTPRDDVSGEDQTSVAQIAGGHLLANLPKRRHAPLWSFATPAVVISDPKAPEGEETRERLPGSTRERASTTGEPAKGAGGDSLASATREDEDDESRTIRVRPVRTEGWDPDTRLREVEAAVKGTVPALPKGTHGVLLRGTEDRSQQLVFVPGSLPLVAVHHAGDPEYGTLVYDLDQENKPDPDRAAPLQRHLRVVPVDEEPCSALTAQSNLSWVLGLTGRGRLSGHGMCTDSLGSKLEEFEDYPRGERTKPPRDGSTRERGRDETRERGSESEPADDGELDQDQLEKRRDAVQAELAQIGRRLSQIEQQIQSLATADPSGLPVGSVQGQTARARQIGRLQAERTTLRERQHRLQQELGELDQTLERREGDGTGLSSGGSLAHGLFGARVGGPLEVGGRGCPHKHGVDRDGRSIYTGHVSTQTLYRGLVGDAPKEYQAIPYSQPGSLPETARVHHRLDPEDEHEWACGKAPGRWRWEAESAFRPRRPEVPGGTVFGQGPGGGAGGGGGGGGGAGGGGGGGGGSGAGAGAGAGAGGGAAAAVLLFGELAEAAGFQPGALDGSGATRATVSDLAAAIRQRRLGRDGFPVAGTPVCGESPAQRRLKLGGVTERHPTASSRLRIGGGLALATRGTVAGQIEPSAGAGVLDADKRETVDKAPTAVVFEAFSRNREGIWGGEPLAEGTVGREDRGTVDGGWLAVPPSVDLEDVITGHYSPQGNNADPGVRARLVVPGNLSCIDLATPRRDLSNDNVTVDGVRMQQDAVGAAFVLIDGNGDENAAVRQRIGEGGFVFDGDVTCNDDVSVAGKLTVTGMIDPPGVKCSESAADPGSTGAGEGTYWVRDDTPCVPVFTDDAGTDHVLTTGGGGGGSSKGHIAGLHYRYLTADTLEVFPGVCRDRQDAADVELTTVTAADATTSVSGTEGSARSAAASGGLDVKNLSGTVSVSSGSNNVTGSGTAFLTEFAPGDTPRTLTGTSSISSNTITGSGTRFLDEVSPNDLIGQSSGGNAYFVRVESVDSDTQLTVSGAGAPAWSGATMELIEQPTLELDDGTDTECRPLLQISSDTALQMASGAGADRAYSGDTGRAGARPFNDATDHDADSWWVSVWVVDGSSGTGVLLSGQRTALLNPPTGYDTSERRTGWIRDEDDGTSPAFMECFQTSGTERRTVYERDRADTRVVSSGSSSSWSAVDLADTIPPGAQAALVQLTHTGTSGVLSVRARNRGDSSAHGHHTSNDRGDANEAAPVDGKGSRQIDYLVGSGASDAFIHVFGWLDNAHDAIEGGSWEGL